MLEFAAQVLVYDAHGRDILAPLAGVAQLRDLGIGHFDLITAERDPVPGAGETGARLA